MKIHKIEDERLGTVRRALNEAIVNLYHGNEKIAQDLVQKAISNLVTEGPIHEDRWELVWMKEPLIYITRPAFIPEDVWPHVNVWSLWAYDTTVICHAASAGKLRIMYPLGAWDRSIENGGDHFINALRRNGDAHQFWEKLDEFASEVVSNNTSELFSMSSIDNMLRSKLDEQTLEGWQDYRDCHSDEADFDDDKVRTDHMVRFLEEWCRDACLGDI